MAYDYSNQRFSRLTAIRLLKQRSASGARRWLCKCDCGRQCIVEGGNLNSGHTRSCGCLHTEVCESKGADLTGKRFGHLKALQLLKERSAGGRRLWLCQCLYRDEAGEVCGRKKPVMAHSLTTGKTKTCGRHGRGNLKKGGFKHPRRKEHAAKVETGR